ncbi:hypothetical protein KTF21_06340 [Burkholderia multivorans]|uniref:hypothetical protein n=1 Tax=Burkholderia multivorans TaxID=87883 RepID=UPI001C243D4B|nr:hypothetical protein [Burkholderia multivorans]MBU9648298.1 hypothetical protein [Burkholderia multivorans]
MSDNASSLPVGSNSFGFSMPDGFSSGAAMPSLAGLTGIGSGMNVTAPNVGPNTYGFTMPGTDTLGKLSDTLGAASKALSVPQPTTMGGMGGRGAGMGLRAQEFSAPIANFVAAPGSVGGNGLLQMLMNYRPGTIA